MRSRKSQRFCAFFLLFLFLMGNIGCGKKQEDILLEEVQIDETDKIEKIEETKEEPSTIVVHVCGAVNAPGVYECDAESRIFEGIAAAGGLAEYAASDSLNQAEKMTDGQRIYIYSEEEMQSGVAEGTLGNPAANQDSRVDINHASVEELMTLTGIGQKKAEAIIAHRESQGLFQSVEELMNVAGIKEGTFEKIKEQIRV